MLSYDVFLSSHSSKAFFGVLGVSQSFDTTLIVEECACINSFPFSLARRGQSLNMGLIPKG